MAVVQWSILSRPDCSLCETLQGDLLQLLGPGACVQVVDIGEDAELERKYGTRIPVLLADDEFVCAYKLDLERVRAYLRAG